MKIAILSRAMRLYSTKRLREAAVKRGHNVKVLSPLHFAIDLPNSGPRLNYKGKKLSTYDAILPRIGTSITYFGTALVRQFEQMGVYTPNTSDGISNSRDKLRSMQMLCRHDINIPATTYVRDRKDAEPSLERIGGTPVVIKLLKGTHGMGVMLSNQFNNAVSIIQSFYSVRQQVLLQQFVAESAGRDLRVIVVGDRAVAAMRRVAQGDEFRSNLHRGATASKADTTPEQEEAAIRAARIMGLSIAGVDMLESDEGPMVLEINSSPGLQGVETATGLDVAGEIIDYISGQVEQRKSQTG